MGTEFFWKEALLCTKRALESGAISPLSTTILNISSTDDPEFELRHLSGLPPRHLRDIGPKPNPFSPWDSRLEVSSISKYHVLILNKYPVQKAHMLLITKAWAAQDDWLTFHDWSALAKINKDTSGLWFFNSGPDAGASQPHRHFQLLPRQSGEISCPRNDWFLSRVDQKNDSSQSFLDEHCAVIANNVSRKEDDGYHLMNRYIDLLHRLEIGNPERDPKPKYPYNILLTNEWMALIRRQRDGIHGFSVNALGFAGYLLSTDESDLDWLHVNGPESLLNEVV